MNYQCTFCQFRMFENIINKHQLDEATKNKIVHDFVTYLAESDRKKSAPRVARDLHKEIRDMINNPDPYREDKKHHNEYMLSKYEELKSRINHSFNPFETALRIAVAANIIDFGPAQHFDINTTIEEVLNAHFAIDQSQQLYEDIQQAGTILYLGDNTGEIVADRLLIELIDHPNVYFAVRGSPIINDVTEEDARQTGMDQVAKVISNGYDAPSTLLNEVSEEFLDIYNQADVVISKGQGNLEGLLEERNPNIYFLLTVKCELIGSLIGVNKGDFVVVNNHLIHGLKEKNLQTE